MLIRVIDIKEMKPSLMSIKVSLIIVPGRQVASFYVPLLFILYPSDIHLPGDSRRQSRILSYQADDIFIFSTGC